MTDGDNQFKVSPVTGPLTDAECNRIAWQEIQRTFDEVAVWHESGIAYSHLCDRMSWLRLLYGTGTGQPLGTLHAGNLVKVENAPSDTPADAP